MCEQKTLNEWYEESFGGPFELFRLMVENEMPLPFEEVGLNVDPDVIDLTVSEEYGERLIAPICKRHLYDNQLAEYIYKRLIDRMKRYAADFSAEYNPSENYISHEEESYEETPSGKDTTTESYKNYKEVQKYGHTVTTDSDSNVYGFDTTSTDGVDFDKSNTTTSFDQGEGQTGDERSIEGSHETEWSHGAKTDTLRTLDRHGNIGVKTAGEMLAGDLIFYETHDLVQMIARDAAEILTIPAYN